MTTREQIIAAAREAAKWQPLMEMMPHEIIPFLERFYAIAFEAGRVAEREECAKLVEDSDSDGPDPRDLAEAIRARGESK